MIVEMLEDVLHGRETFAKGEHRRVSDEDGKFFCGNGWAKDLDGQVETATRDIHRTSLNVGGSVHATQSEDL